MQLYRSTKSPYARKCIVAAAERNVPVELMTVDVASLFQSDTVMASVNPLGKVPALVTSDVGTLYDSRVITAYLDGVGSAPPLIPAERAAKMRVLRFEALADGAQDAGLLLRFEAAWRPADKQSAEWTARQTGKLTRAIAEMSTLLGDRLWCEGDSMSLADIAVVCCIDWVADRFPEIKWRAHHPNLARLADRLTVRPAFQATSPHTA